MRAEPKDPLDRLDAEIVKLKDALWNYRFAREDAKRVVGSKGGGIANPITKRERLKAVAVELASAARGIVETEQALRVAGAFERRE